MAVYDDYCQRQWQRYFTRNFVDRHLRPFVALPAGDHQGARQRAREGNLHLIERQAESFDVTCSSLIYDVDFTTPRRQVLHLMQEVEQRNASNHYQSNSPPFVTDSPFFVHTTTFGSRHDFVHRRVRYGVIPVGDRLVIHHLAGVE